MIPLATAGRSSRLCGMVLALALAFSATGCASRSATTPVDWDAADVISYRLVTKQDFKARSSGSVWGNVAHGAEICTHMIPSKDFTETGAFRAVMKQDCSFWNKIVGPVGWIGRMLGMLVGLPVPVPVKQPDWYILQHEQLHFAIVEVAARRLSRKVAELPAERRQSDGLRRAYRASLMGVAERHREFDAETSGTFDPRGLEKWVRVLEIEMQRFCGDGSECQVRQ